jgi:AraC-like DNA-binding protein
VIEVCFQSGFGSVTRFNAAFRSAFASSPTTYRRTHAAA